MFDHRRAMNEKNSEQWNNGINNEEISSAKTLDNQNLSKEIKMENEQSYDVRKRDNTIISNHSELQRREQGFKDVELPPNEQEQEGSMEVKSQQQLSNRNVLGIFTR